MSGGSLATPSMEIRSFRVVFAVERRIHQIDRWRIPVPYGLPVRALGYGVTALALIVLSSRLPAVGALVGLIPAPLRFVVLPGAAGFLLSRVRVDGRPAHSFLLASARYRFAPKYISGFRPAFPPGTVLRIAAPLAFASDEHSPSIRKGRLRGPARLRAAYPMAGAQQGRKLVLEQTSGRPLASPKVVAVGAGARVEFR